jgi:hypothetical protein
VKKNRFTNQTLISKKSTHKDTGILAWKRINVIYTQKARRHKGVKAQRHEGAKAQRSKGTNATKAQSNKGTKSRLELTYQLGFW